MNVIVPAAEKMHLFTNIETIDMKTTEVNNNFIPI